MKCARCQRRILRGINVFGLSLGPVCARKVLEEAGKLPARKPRATDAVVRDELTADLFEGVA